MFYIIAGGFMNNRIFNRYERKYMINRETMKDLLVYFRNYLAYDPYSTDGNFYTIYNLYFDTKDFGIIRSSIQKPRYKEKLRLRTYDNPLKPESIVFLEIKKKHNGRVNKRRVTLSYQAAEDYLNHGILPTFNHYNETQMMNEIDYFIRIHEAKPGAYIRYDRIALLSEKDDIRITFDTHLIYRTKKLSLEYIDGKSILPQEDSVLMEIKSENNFPLWIAQKLSSLKLYSQSFSKYGKAYEDYLGGTTDDDIIYNH